MAAFHTELNGERVDFRFEYDRATKTVTAVYGVRTLDRRSNRGIPMRELSADDIAHLTAEATESLHFDDAKDRAERFGTWPFSPLARRCA